MIISDLNVLEVVEAAEVVGGLIFLPNTYNFTKNVNATFNNNYAITGSSNVTDIFSKTGTYAVTSTVTGNSASVSFDNEAVGNASNTQVSVSQLVKAGQSSNQSGIIVASAGY
ncbi:hypothetical protein ACSQ6I_08385 [Anabaena sp. WFMT]|uniref:hypothetical protein n=1 Tax=Anabaena sp. WFMT TaxID=3449730 RepID=UPI003F246E09